MSNFILVLLGPSGVGKGTIMRRLLADYPHIFHFIPSCTTRERRSDDRDGQYIYMQHEEFLEGISQSIFLEYASVHKKYYYGTRFSDINTQAICPIKEMDTQGVIQAKKHNNTRIITLFILPSSLEILEKRIRSRSIVSEEEVQRRLASASREMEYKNACDMVCESKDGDEEESYQRCKQALQSFMPWIFDQQ